MRCVLDMLRVGLIVVLLGAWTTTVQAQESYSLDIQDGVVYVNGEEVPADQLPPSLNVEGIEAHFSFFGDARPVVELGGRRYVVSEGGLTEERAASSADGRVPVFFRDGTVPPEDAPSSSHAGAGVPGPDWDGDPSFEHLREQMQALYEHARELQAVKQQVHQQRLNQLVEQMRVQAEQAAHAVEALPEMELQHYLEDVQRHSQDLYERLRREWELERETRELGADIQSLAQGDERAAKVEQLRSRLEEIFELKQQNRRREVEQLERQLDELRSRLERRERQRDQIIDRRLRELIGARPEENGR